MPTDRQAMDYGQGYRIWKPSFEGPLCERPSFGGGLPLSSQFGYEPSGRPNAEDWEHVEALFESNWFGPCGCLGAGWGVVGPPARSNSRPEPSSAWSQAAAAMIPTRTPVSTPAPTPSTAAPISGGLFASLFRRSAAAPDPGPAAKQPSAAPAPPAPTPGGPAPAAAGPGLPPAAPAPPPPVYGAAAAPAPEAMPVPRRGAAAAAAGDGDTGSLPVTLPAEPAPAPAPAEPSQAQPAPAVRSTAVNGTDPMELTPQLGTWANRQYRLLDPVPERGELAAGSGGSGPSSSSNPRSPLVAGAPATASEAGSGHGSYGAGGAGGSGSGVASAAHGSSGSGGDGSGTGNGSGGSIAAATNRTGGGGGGGGFDGSGGPTLLELLSQRWQQEDIACAAGSGQPSSSAANGRNGYANGHPTAEDLDERGRRRAGGGPLLSAFQQMQERDREQQPLTPEEQAALLARQRELEEQAMQDAAWRWRFTRRWQAEQARNPERSASSAGDALEEALAYLNATGATTTTSVSMQIANAPRRGRRGGGGALGGAGSNGPGWELSLEGSQMLASLVGTTLGGTLGQDWPLGAAGGSGSGSFTTGPRILGRQQSGELLAATREVASLNRRAAVVLQQQLECELNAERRVQESLAPGPPWVGHHIPVVQIDEWGSFRFLMLKLRDQSGSRGAAAGGIGGATLRGAERQRIVIRGHNYGSEGQLMEEANREIMSLVQKHGVAFEAPTVMGGGVMEWRRDRDRHLHLHSGFVVDRALPLGLGPGGPSGARPASAMDLLNLAAALARQTFPPTYKITVLA
ncbi:hypothetical protein HYH03_008950 [Edaphochlamys debaryana]|uniref:Uncharacterized protein n=1 Tax=Edaphochlamys debaryana TaxID=47281 RepID=A0A836BXQ0_9CHLO|nr:hypothetical protein HYH03_008950 [Edaphochlamys debaryana]|eukprot:KAG2492790.1 hypothetical protein HYH03_008950 [Edaphochlamys debaryana]